jgi:hypothetical protein
MQPDEDTKQRIKNLAVVGAALFQISDDNMGNTKFFIAKTSLQEFKKGINKLDLDPESKKGMDDLISYLDKKIDKRLKQSDLTATDQTYRAA